MRKEDNEKFEKYTVMSEKISNSRFEKNSRPYNY